MTSFGAMVGSSPKNATWEWLEEFKATYPHFNLEDKVSSEVVGNEKWTSDYQTRLAKGFYLWANREPHVDNDNFSLYLNYSIR